MKNLSINKVLGNIGLAMVFGAILSVISGFSAVATSGALAVLGLVPNIQGAGVLSMALQTESWVKDIQEKLFNDSAFVKYSVDHSEFVVNKTVHVPQAAAAPGITVNRSSFPATIVERTDTDLTYNVDSYSTEPVLVRDFDEMQLSYAKRNSVMGSHFSILDERIGDQVAFNWSTATAARHIVTSGATTALAPDGAALRNLLTKEDIAKAAKLFDNDKMPKSGRYLMLTPEMYYNLFSQDELLRKDFMNKAALPKGVIDQLFGFNIMVRSTVVNFDGQAAGAAKKAIGATVLATDSFGALAWHESAVTRAEGGIHMFYEAGKAAYYGDIMSAEVGLGAAKLTTVERGIVNIIQGS